MDLLDAQTEPPHLVEDLIGGFYPGEGLPALVVRVDVGQDGVPQLGDAGVGSALERFLGEQPEEALDQVEPRGVGRREMKVDVEGAGSILSIPSPITRGLLDRLSPQAAKGQA